MKKFGLIGKSLSHSFSADYFNNKFKRLRINAVYENIEIPTVSGLEKIPFADYEFLNVTIPYKTDIITCCDSIEEAAQEIGAVNTLIVNKDRIKGYNTDWIGFKDSLTPLLKPDDKRAVILGTGGSSKAVYYALEQMNIEPVRVSRNPRSGQLHYDALTPAFLNSVQIIINTTPLGMYPDTDRSPAVSSYALNQKHLVYDLIYNPSETTLIKRAKRCGCRTKNGREMLIKQAEAAWNLYTKHSAK